MQIKLNILFLISQSSHRELNFYKFKKNTFSNEKINLNKIDP